MHVPRLTLLALAAAALLGGTPAPRAAFADGAGNAAAEQRKARDTIVAKLLAHAKWCRANKLVREARDAWERVISLDEENAEARKSLGHEKKGGRWYPPATPKVPDSPEKLIAEAEAKRKEIVDGFVARCLEIAGAADTPLAVRELALADAVGADATNEPAHKLNREVLDQGVWRLEETVAARVRHEELAAAFKERFDATKPPVLAAADERDAAILGAGALGTTSAFGRVAGTAANAETADVARLQPGLEALYRKAVGEPRGLRTMRVLLFPDHASGVAAAARDPRFKDEHKRLADALAAMWAPGTLDYFCYGETPEGRKESSMRAAVGTWLYWKYQVDAKRGWALEGTCHWFSEMCLGTHRCDFFRPSEYAENPGLRALSDELRAEGADWIKIGAGLAVSDNWPGIRTILAKDVNSLGPEGLLTSYLFARYLIEGRPKQVEEVLTAVGATEQPDKWFERLLQSTPEGFDRRLRRWVQEMAAVKVAAPAPAPTPPVPAPPAPVPPAPAPGGGPEKK